MSLFSGKRWLWAVILFNAVAIPVVYTVGQPKFRSGAAQQETAGPMARYGKLADFTLTQQDGETFASPQMDGSYWVADFIFTRCPAQCPMMSAKLAALQERLPQDVRLASFSVDPANDTPEKMAAFSKPYGARPERWVFLTGDAETLKAVRRSAHLGDEEDPDMHSLRFVLLDKERNLRGYYDATDADAVERIERDLDRLRRQG